MIKRWLSLSIVVGLALMLATPILADFQSGWDAYERGDYDTALKEWRPLAEQGDASAQNNLGRMYGNGRGVSRDYGEAMKWFRLAAEQGNAYAQNNLGIMYAEGLGVPQNDQEAAKWFPLAAEQGHARAQYYLGYMYTEGLGVSQDDAEAMKWFRLAAEQGDAKAQAALGVLKEELNCKVKLKEREFHKDIENLDDNGSIKILRVEETFEKGIFGVREHEVIVVFEAIRAISFTSGKEADLMITYYDAHGEPVGGDRVEAGSREGNTLRREQDTVNLGEIRRVRFWRDRPPGTRCYRVWLVKDESLN